MDGRRREAIASEARRLLAGACCALGGLVGIWTAIWSLPVTHRHGTIGADLAALAPPMLVHLGLGVCAGAGSRPGASPCGTPGRARSKARLPVGREGLEPSTLGLRVPCSASCAN